LGSAALKAPLSVGETIRVDDLSASSVPITAVSLDADGNGTPDIVGANLDGQTFTYQAPGLYQPTVTVIATDNSVHTASAVVRAFASAELDNMLLPKWTAMKTALRAGDVQGALTYIAVDKRPTYAAMFGALTLPFGSIDLLIEVFPVVMEQIKSGMIKGLAVSSPYRLPSVPDLPTFKQAGVPGVELTGWLGIYGPPRMPEEARATLGKAIVEMVKQGDMKDKFRTIGFEPTGLSVSEFSAFYESEVKRWVAFMTETGIRK
jgi:hypothetical protein